MTTSQVDQSTLVAGRQAIQGTWRLDGRTMAISGLVNARSLHARFLVADRTAPQRQRRQPAHPGGAD